jgi:glycine/D-amino acid oxidase-like deaminating enzyme
VGDTQVLSTGRCAGSAAEGKDVSASSTVVVIGAGIVGVSAALWLRRAGVDVVLVDRAGPGEATSYGNAGVLAACAVVPVTGPKLARRLPGYLLDRDSPLFLRWPYLPRLAPWLARYLAFANVRDTRRIAEGLAQIVADSVAQHHAIADGTPAARWLVESDYAYAYADRRAFEADAYAWELRALAGFEPAIIEGRDVQRHEPALGQGIGLVASLRDHGFITDPGAYVAALASAFVAIGGRVLRADVMGVEIERGRVRSVATEDGPIKCDACVLAAGVWSKPIMAKLGVSVPLESERGYHIVFKSATGAPRRPVMVAAGKFVATPMDAGLRCAGIVEFGGTQAGPSRAPLEYLRRHAHLAFPSLEAVAEEEWLGHRPAPTDSLPLIGELKQSRVFAAFGHHHVGLTSGPKTGRLVAEAITGQTPSADLAFFKPSRFC